MLKLHTFTLSSADAPWLKGVREGALAVARTASSDSANYEVRATSECQNFPKGMCKSKPLR